MTNLKGIEKHFKKFSKNLADWLPEGILTVEIGLLHRLGLLNYHDNDHYDPALTCYFQVIETKHKITLLNDEFVVWIVPMNEGLVSTTYTLIALTHSGNPPHLELAFASSGVYNSPQLILRILEKLLHDIRENEEALIGLREQM